MPLLERGNLPPTRSMQARAGGSGTGISRAGVNKTFLLNTVNGLKSHNQREEVEDCWRQHGLEQRVRDRRLSHDASCRARVDSTKKISREPTCATSEVDARRFWAEQKQRAMTAAAESTSANTKPFDDDDDVGFDLNKGEHLEEGIAHVGDERMRKRKSAKKKAKKKKKRKRERSRHSSCCGSSDACSNASSAEEIIQREGGRGGSRSRRKQKNYKQSGDKKGNR